MIESIGFFGGCIAIYVVTGVIAIKALKRRVSNYSSNMSTNMFFSTIERSAFLGPMTGEQLERVKDAISDYGKRATDKDAELFLKFASRRIWCFGACAIAWMLVLPRLTHGILGIEP